jgi:hypothetical protein
MVRLQLHLVECSFVLVISLVCVSIVDGLQLVVLWPHQWTPESQANGLVLFQRWSSLPPTDMGRVDVAPALAAEIAIIVIVLIVLMVFWFVVVPCALAPLRLGSFVKGYMRFAQFDASKTVCQRLSLLISPALSNRFHRTLFPRVRSSTSGSPCSSGPSSCVLRPLCRRRCVAALISAVDHRQVRETTLSFTRL